MRRLMTSLLTSNTGEPIPASVNSAFSFIKCGAGGGSSVCGRGTLKVFAVVYVLHCK